MASEKKAVNPTEPICLRCGDGYGAPSHNTLGYMYHEFVSAHSVQAPPSSAKIGRDHTTGNLYEYEVAEASATPEVPAHWDEVKDFIANEPPFIGRGKTGKFAEAGVEVERQPSVEVYQGFVVVKCDELVVQIGPEDTDEDAEFVANVMRKILARVAARAPHQPKPVNSPNITPQQLTSETCPRCQSCGQECAMCRHTREDYEAS